MDVKRSRARARQTASRRKSNLGLSVGCPSLRRDAAVGVVQASEYRYRHELRRPRDVGGLMWNRRLAAEPLVRSRGMVVVFFLSPHSGLLGTFRQGFLGEDRSFFGQGERPILAKRTPADD